MSIFDPKDLFRKEALDNATSSEQLDQPVRVVGPLGWISMAIVWPILLLALAWSIWGRLPTTVAGAGILLRGGAIHSVRAQADGQLQELYVALGESVQAGQIVGSVRQPLLENQIAVQESSVRQLETQLATITSNQNEILRGRLESIEAQRATALQMQKDYHSRRDTLRRIVAAQEGLLKQGLITEVVFYNSSSQLADVEQSLSGVQSTLIDLAAQASTADDAVEQTIFQAESSLLGAQNQLSQLQRQLDVSGKLVSPYAGRVASMEALPGQNVFLNTPVLDLEVESEELMAIAFFPAALGKKIQADMRARISPATVQIEEFGYIVGSVSFVSDLPSSQQSMDSLLRNADLTRELSVDGAPLRADVRLRPSAKTPTGFQWSSSIGPKTRITPGTLCTVQVVTEEQPPITLLIPMLKKFFGVQG
jgi:HlyD family secretion protein